MGNDSIRNPIFYPPPPIKPSTKVEAQHHPRRQSPQIPDHDLDASSVVHPALDLPKNTKGRSHAYRFSKPGKEVASNDPGKEKPTGMEPQAVKKAAHFMPPQEHSATGAAVAKSSKIGVPSVAQAKNKSSFA